MRAYVTSPPWEPVRLSSGVVVEDLAFSNAGGAALLFDFQPFGKLSTGLRFVVRVDSGSATFTPESSHWAAGPADTGHWAMAPFTLSAGQCWVEPLGLDNVPPFVRLWVSGAASGVYTIEKIQRCED